MAEVPEDVKALALVAALDWYGDPSGGNTLSVKMMTHHFEQAIMRDRLTRQDPDIRRAALEEADGWQPIETVPHGDVVMLWWSGDEAEVASIKIGKIETLGNRRLPVVGSVIYNVNADRFTHWRPLLAPPRALSDKGGEHG